jgi:hypothetical protein
VSRGTTFKNVKGGKGRDGGAGFPGQGDPSERVEERHDARRQIKSRIAQLQGDFPKAIRTYLNVQLAELPPAMVLPEELQEKMQNLPPDKRPKGNGPYAMETPKREFFLNFRAAEDAKFWMAVCQMQQHEWDLAEETFNSYLRRYGQAGVGTWVVQAAYLRSLCLAENKKFALGLVAIAQLASALQENDYRRTNFELLSERWRTARDASKPQASGTETPKEQPAAAGAKSEPAAAKPAASDKATDKTSAAKSAAPPAGSAPSKAPTTTPAPSGAKPTQPKSP